MHVTFHTHVPPGGGEQLYIRLDSGQNHHSREVVDRAATEADKARYREEWAAYEAMLAPPAPAAPVVAPELPASPAAEPPAPPPPHEEKHPAHRRGRK